MKTLLLIDCQHNDYLNSENTHAKGAVEKCIRLLEDFRQEQNKIIHIYLKARPYFESNQWRMERLSQSQEILDDTVIKGLESKNAETVIWKTQRSAFRDTDLTTHLSLDDDIFCVGAATTGCVLATAIDGEALGYKMNFVSDCIFDRNTITHQAGVQVLSKFGRLCDGSLLARY